MDDRVKERDEVILKFYEYLNKSKTLISLSSNKMANLIERVLTVEQLRHILDDLNELIGDVDIDIEDMQKERHYEGHGLHNEALPLALWLNRLKPNQP